VRQLSTVSGSIFRASFNSLLLIQADIKCVKISIIQSGRQGIRWDQLITSFREKRSLEKKMDLYVDDNYNFATIQKAGILVILERNKTFILSQFTFEVACATLR